MRVATYKSFSNFKFFLISIVVLFLTARFAYAFFFWRPRIIRWTWSNCRVRFRWFRTIIVCQQNVGAPAPLNCGAGYAFNGVCYSRTSMCPAGSGQVLVASTNNPCRCEAAGYTAGANQRICGNDPNGVGVCTTNGNVPGISSTCGLSCVTNFIESNGRCMRAAINPASCVTPNRIGFGTDGCKCVNPSALGGPTNDQPCLILATATGPNGFANCRVTAAGGDPCYVQCNAGFTANYRTCNP